MTDHDKTQEVPRQPVPTGGFLHAALQDVRQERERQDLQWGGPGHDDQHSPNDWLAFIMRLLGKAAAVADGTPHDVGTWKHRLTQVAALCVAAIEAADRKAMPVGSVACQGCGRPVDLDSAVCYDHAAEPGEPDSGPAHPRCALRTPMPYNELIARLEADPDLKRVFDAQCAYLSLMFGQKPGVDPGYRIVERKTAGVVHLPISLEAWNEINVALAKQAEGGVIRPKVETEPDGNVVIRDWHPDPGDSVVVTMQIATDGEPTAQLAQAWKDVATAFANVRFNVSDDGAVTVADREALGQAGDAFRALNIACAQPLTAADMEQVRGKLARALSEATGRPVGVDTRDTWTPARTFPTPNLDAAVQAANPDKPTTFSILEAEQRYAYERVGMAVGDRLKVDAIVNGHTTALILVRHLSVLAVAGQAFAWNPQNMAQDATRWQCKTADGTVLQLDTPIGSLADADHPHSPVVLRVETMAGENG